jgi:Zn-dependent oligopeptidase
MLLALCRFFHEFGHVMHGLCAKVKYSRFHGTAVERDFVECPSQMLENWCWDESILERISGHYEDESKSLPKELLQKYARCPSVASPVLHLLVVVSSLPSLLARVLLLVYMCLCRWCVRVCCWLLVVVVVFSIPFRPFVVSLFVCFVSLLPHHRRFLSRWFPLLSHACMLLRHTHCRMLAAKNLDSGLIHLRQVFFGVFDQKLHSQEESDTAAVYGELRNSITHVRHTEGTNPTAQFGHIAGGYEASYYSYLWAEVFSADLFEQFKLGGVMNKELGLKYVQTGVPCLSVVFGV